MLTVPGLLHHSLSLASGLAQGLFQDSVYIRASEQLICAATRIVLDNQADVPGYLREHIANRSPELLCFRRLCHVLGIVAA